MTDGALPGTIRIRLGVVAIASLLLTVAALTTLVIVVATTRADLLSVVALALAVIAFSAQLIIYIVQAGESSASTRRALELHAELNGLLSELRERTGSTQRSMEVINERLLEAAIGKAQADAPDSGNEFAERVATTYAKAARADDRDAAATNLREAIQVAKAGYPPALPEEEAARVNKFMSEWPSADEVTDIVSTVEGLSSYAQESLEGMARDLASSTTPDSPIGPGLARASTTQDDAPYMRQVPGWDMYVLNDEGMRLARFFTAIGPPPPGAERLAEIRKDVRERKRGRASRG